jgi:hypothetical protein
MPGPPVWGMTDLKQGTAIAVFGADGRYTNDKDTAHAAIYLDQNENGIRVLEQYVGQKPQVKTYPPVSRDLPIKDARNYRVIEVKK